MAKELKSAAKKFVESGMELAGLHDFTEKGFDERAKEGKSFFGSLDIWPEYAYNPDTGKVEKTGNYISRAESQKTLEDANNTKKETDKTKQKAKIYAQELKKR